MTVNTLTCGTELVDYLGEIDIGEGLLISFEQTIEFRDGTDVAANIISFEQTVQDSIPSTLIISFEQTIVDSTELSRYDKFGFYPIIAIDGVRIPDDQLTGIATYTHAEDNSALLEFTIRPYVGIQNVYFYQGKVVTCDIKVSGNIYRIFTGRVDIPEIDVMNEEILLRCSDNRESRIANGEAGSLALIGNYSTTVFGAVVDTKQEALARLSTVPYSLDFDGYGNKYLTSWTPKSSADYTLGDSSIYRTEPTIRFESRGKLVNTVSIDFTYSYQRFHEQNISYVWEVPYSNAYFLTNSPSLCSKEMIRAAVQSTSWDLIGEIGFDPLLASGFYNIGGVTVAWSTSNVSGGMIAKTATNPIPGGSPIPVLDANGNQVYTAIPTSVTDLSDVFCSGAAFNLGKRFSQSIEEVYTLTVTSPQSVAQYGAVNDYRTYTFTDQDYSQAWDQSKATVGSYYVDQDVNTTEFNNATTVIINQAKTDILRAHRDTRVTFSVFIWPQIDLRHTVALTSGRIQCKGKVSAIQHKWDMSMTSTQRPETTVELALYRGIGSQAESLFIPPTRPSDTYTASDLAIALGSHYGLDPSVPYAKYWTGHIGNAYIAAHEGAYIDYRRTTYPESFVIDTPPIPDSQRLKRTLTATQTYNVSIPTNNLIWTTFGTVL